MRKVYINPDGKESRRPKYVELNGVTYIPPKDSQLVEAGWEIREIIDPIPEPTPEPEPYVPTYEEKVVQYIRERYSIDDELALLRQRDTKPDEFEEYNEYCEECKRRAKEDEV